MAKPWWQPTNKPLLKVGNVSVSFEPRDIWIGVFWDHREGVTQIFVTVVPCFPIRIVKAAKK